MERFGYKCPECGKGIVRQKELINYKTKINNYAFTVPKAIIGICDVCGSKNFDPKERRRWIDLFHQELESRHRVLSSEKIAETRKALGLSMEDFAYLIGCTRQSIHNWEDKKRKIPQSRMADLMIKLVRQNIYKGEPRIMNFLLQEAKKMGIQIHLEQNILLIVLSKEYKPAIHPIEEYSKNFSKTQEPLGGFSPKLKIIA